LSVQPFNVLWIDQNRLPEMAFEGVPHRSPVLACGLHRDPGDFTVLQPRPELLQIPRECGEVPSADLYLRLADGRQNTDRHALLMHVDAATAAIVDSHYCSFGSPGEGRLEMRYTTFLRVFIPPERYDPHILGCLAATVLFSGFRLDSSLGALRNSYRCNNLRAVKHFPPILINTPKAIALPNLGLVHRAVASAGGVRTTPFLLHFSAARLEATLSVT
jgi:hypothetical protein